MFERFNPDARRAVVLAQEQARALDHNYIGTEHLVLAMLADGSGSPAGRALADLAVTYARFKDEVLGIVGCGEGASSGHIPFTPRSKKVLELSLREALRLKSKSIGSEHILLGLIREGEGLACQILVKLGADLERLKDELEGRMPPVEGFRRRRFRSPDPRVTALTRGGARVGERAVEHAGGSPVGSHHYLLGVLDDPDSLASRALVALGVTPEALKSKLDELGTDGTSDESPERAGARRTTVEVVGDAIAVRIEEPDLASRLREQMARNQADVLRGLDIPGSERIWSAVAPAIRDVVAHLEATDWTPPDWSQDGLAAFAVAATTDRPRTRLWVAEGVDEHEVRRFLAGWLPSRAAPDEECGYLTVTVDRSGGALYVTKWACGGPSPIEDTPRVPLSDLVAAAIEDLQPPAGASIA